MHDLEGRPGLVGLQSMALRTGGLRQLLESLRQARVDERAVTEVRVRRDAGCSPLGRLQRGDVLTEPSQAPRPIGHQIGPQTPDVIG